MRTHSRLRLPLRDVQLECPVVCCSVCQGEIYTEDSQTVVGGMILCEICEKEYQDGES